MDEIKGRYEVEFVNGITRIIDILEVISDINGHPIYLRTWIQKLYNWNTIISIRKVD